MTCGSLCENYETAGYYVVVSAQLAYTPVLPYSLLGSSKTLERSVDGPRPVTAEAAIVKRLSATQRSGSAAPWLGA